jgi:hypothetical protein
MTPNPCFERVLNLMVDHGWLRSPAIVENGSVRLDWTLQGARQAWLLKLISESFQLQSPEALLEFDRSCHLDHDTPNDTIHFDSAAVAMFWQACIKDLNLPRSEEFLQQLVRIAIEWGPPDDARLDFG